MIYNNLEDVKKFRNPEFEISPTILKRWSPRSMTGETIDKNELMSLFEAAKWAPSSFNEQPWRFLYATKDSSNWQLFFELMGEFNQGWTKNAAALVLVISRNNFAYNDKPNVNHSFDAGAAWENLALEASEKGLVAHAMAGFDADKARVDLKVPEHYSIEAMIAIGKPAKKEDLPEGLQENEKPSDRKKLTEIIKEGIFSFDN
jgi:nitroreductase